MALRAVAVATAAALGAIPDSEKGQPNGVATLDASGKIPTAQMPVGDVTYKGNWNATTNSPLLINGTGVAGDLHICDVAGTQNLGGGIVNYGVGDWLIYDGAAWDRVAGHGPAPANPSVTVGLTAKNGTAGTFMRSDGAPALDQAIAPTWTGAHTFNETITAAAITASGLIQSNAGLAGNTYVKAGIGSNSVQMNGAPSGNDVVIEALGATDANVSLEVKAKGTGLLKFSSPISVSGAATFGSTVNVAGQLGSGAGNTNAPSPTNSGVTIGGAPNWGMASFYDAGRTVNNRSFDILFIGDGVHLRFANDARTAFLDFLTVLGGQALGITGIATTSGTGAWTHTGNQTIVKNADGNKLWLAKYASGSGHNNAPTALGAASTYLQIGGTEYGNNGFGGIGFSYVADTTNHPAVWIGWEEKVTAGFTNGDFIIATRNVTTNTAPTERLRVTAAGDLLAAAGYVPATPQSLATVADLPARAADGKTAQAANVNVPGLYAVPASGLYRVSTFIEVTQAATTSSTMPSVSVNYTTAVGGVAVADLMTATAAGNNPVGTHLGGTAVISAQQGSNIGYTTAGYASVGATPMQYSVHVTLERLG